jgi:hypothetical protein
MSLSVSSCEGANRTLSIIVICDAEKTIAQVTTSVNADGVEYTIKNAK